MEFDRGPQALRWANLIVRGLDRLKGGRILVLEEEALLREAMWETGLEDYGDQALLEPLSVLCQFSRTDKPMSAFGRYFLRSNVRARLINRLNIQGDLCMHPEILEERIEKPIFIVGLPGTGMTILHRLLALDPANRTPRFWESIEPSPPPHRITYRTDPRIARAEKRLKNLKRLVPGLRTVHELGAELPGDCISLMANGLVSWWFGLLYGEAYARWLRARDLTDAYRLHKGQLQLLQWHCRAERWVLRAAWHLHGLPWLLKVYPDARIIMTHRDPLEVLPSCASRVTTLRAAMFATVDPCRIALGLMEELSGWVNCALSSRRLAETNGKGAAFVDVPHHGLRSDPLAVIEGIYEEFGLDLTREVRKRMQVYLGRNPEGKHGLHCCSLEQFGLEASRVKMRFRRYRESYGSHQYAERIGPLHKDARHAFHADF
jgi:hypothetical protein